MRAATAIAFFLCLVHCTLQDNVDTAKACGQLDKPFPNGSAQLISALTGNSYKSACQYRQGQAIGTDMSNFNATAGDVVGFPGNLCWLSIYIGNKGCQCMFIDVPNGFARCWKTDYGVMMYEYYY